MSKKAFKTQKKGNIFSNKKVKFEFELPTWVLAIIYILACSAFGAILGVIIGLLFG